MLLQKEKVKSCEMILRDVAPFKEPTFKSRYNLMRNFGQAVSDLENVGRQISLFIQAAYGITVALPESPIAGAEIAAKPYDVALGEASDLFNGQVSKIAGMFADCPMIGRFEWLNEEIARFTYVTVDHERRLTKVIHHRTQHVHDLVKARSHRLADGIPIRDARARELIRILPATLRSHARVVTGLEIVNGSEPAGSSETPTTLGRIMDRAKRATTAVARGGIETGRAVGVAGAAAIALAGVGTLGALALFSTLAQVVVADPALVIGEYVVYGWEE